MRVIASTRPNRPTLHNIEAVRLNGAFVMTDEFSELSELYFNIPIFFDIPTKREKVTVSNITQSEIVKILDERCEQCHSRIRNIVAISKVESIDDIIDPLSSKLCIKIESNLGVQKLHEFIDKADMVCIDRADLINEVGIFNYMPLENEIVKVSKRHGKEIVIASEILPTIVNTNKPTIPQIIQLHYYKSIGIDYVILAEETAVGFYPYQAIDIVNRTK